MEASRKPLAKVGGRRRMPFSAMHTSTGVESAAQDGGGVAAEVRQRGSNLPRSTRTHPDEPPRSCLAFSPRYVAVLARGYAPSGTFNQGVQGSNP